MPDGRDISNPTPVSAPSSAGSSHAASGSPVEHRAAVLEQLLGETGLEASAFVDDFIANADEHWVPRNGACVVAKAWTDPAFRQRLLANGREAVEELGLSMPPHHRRLVVLENTPDVHNVIVCTLCSCTAFTIIGLAPDWYKDLEYRARVVRQSRTVLKEMGSTCRRRLRSASGIPRPIRATWCYPFSLRRHWAGLKKNWPSWSHRTQ